MASTINAISTGGGGIATTADATGILQLQTNGTTAVTVNASQVVSLTNALPIASGGTGSTSTTFANLTTNVTGTLPIANGGTGLTAPGTSGNILTSNGTAWTSTTPTPVTGSGGSLITGSVTLTAASPASMTVTPTSPGLYVTLPSATTCSEGSILFSIFNTGDYDYGIKNSDGTQLGWVLPGTSCIVGLSDNTTTAGTWNISNLCKIGVTAKKDLTPSASFYPIKTITLDSNRILLLFIDTNLYGIIYDASTLTWGNSTLIRGATIPTVQGLLITTDKVLVVSNPITSTAMETVVLSTSGTTITVNTAVATTLAGNYSTSTSLVAVGTSYIYAYNRATTITGLRAITVSGTVPAVGAETTTYQYDISNTMQLYVSGSVVRLITASSNLVYCSPYTVSGSTLTAGTNASTTLTVAGFKSFQNAAGNIIVTYINTTLYAAIFKLTGTVEAVSAISMGSNPPSNTNGWDLSYISPTKTGVIWVYTAGLSYNFNILTDTSGTASVGTPITGSYSGTFVSLSTFNISTSNVMKAGIFTNSTALMFLIDCSGTSPVLSTSTISMPLNVSSTSTTNYSRPSAGDAFTDGTIDRRSKRSIVVGDTTICIGTYSYGRDSIFTKNGLILNSIPNYVNCFLANLSGINTNQLLGYSQGSLTIIDGAAV